MYDECPLSAVLADNGHNLCVKRSVTLSVTFADNAESVDGWANITADTHKINVTGYAVQKDGFQTALAAWNATFGAQN